MAATVIDVVEHVERGGGGRHQDNDGEGGELGKVLGFNLGGSDGTAKIAGDTESVVGVAVG